MRVVQMVSGVVEEVAMGGVELTLKIVWHRYREKVFWSLSPRSAVYESWEGEREGSAPQERGRWRGVLMLTLESAIHR
jgi:hypothetical protein